MSIRVDNPSAGCPVGMPADLGKPGQCDGGSKAKSDAISSGFSMPIDCGEFAGAGCGALDQLAVDNPELLARLQKREDSSNQFTVTVTITVTITMTVTVVSGY
jgi:hypothetical protein